MADFDWLSAGATVLGGLLGGNEKAPQTTSTSKLDPRIEPYIYGGNGSTGVLPSAQNWFNQNSGGLNQQMINGLNRQYNVYSDPANAQGYANQQSLGQSLLAAPIAGNPFTSGQLNLGSNQVHQATNPVQQARMNTTANYQLPVDQAVQQYGGQPAATTPSNPFIYTAPAPVAPVAPAQVAGPAPGTSLGLIGMGQGDGQGNGSSAGGGYSGGPSTGVGFGGSLAGTTHDLVSAAVHNPGTVTTAAGLIGGWPGQIAARAALAAWGQMSAGDGWADGATSPNSVGGINNYGSFNDQAMNAGLSAAANQAGMGGWGGSAGSDSGRGSQSSNGGRNGGDSGGF